MLRSYRVSWSNDGIAVKRWMDRCCDERGGLYVWDGWSFLHSGPGVGKALERWDGGGRGEGMLDGMWSNLVQHIVEMFVHGKCGMGYKKTWSPRRIYRAYI